METTSECDAAEGWLDREERQAALGCRPSLKPCWMPDMSVSTLSRSGWEAKASSQAVPERGVETCSFRRWLNIGASLGGCGQVDCRWQNCLANKLQTAAEAHEGKSGSGKGEA